MNNMIPLLRSIVRQIITLGLVGSFIYMSLVGISITGEFFGLVALAIGFYFKEKEE